MNRIGAGQAVVDLLDKAGVRTVFGLLGGSMLELYDALRSSDIAYVGARDERAAGHMADAYARITGGPGIVLGAQAGPGVANLVTAIAEAHLAYSPVVAIAGAISREQAGRDTFQEIDQQALFAPISKRSITVPTPDRLPELLAEAMRIAMTGRRGPVVLHVPRDIFASDVPGGTRLLHQSNMGGASSQAQLAEVIDLLNQANRPVIAAGAGFKWSSGSSALAALAETLEIPVVSSTGHHDVMASDHRLHAGQGGPRGNRVASGLTRDADLILALGTRLGFNSTFHSHDFISAEARIVQIDIDGTALGRHFPVDLGIVADARATAVALCENWVASGSTADGWRPWLDTFLHYRAGLVDERAAEAKQTGSPLPPVRALGEIREALPDDVIVTLDTGAMCLQAADRMRFGQSPGLVTPLDFGLVGFGYAAALGAKAAAPHRPVVSIMGDGGFGMTMIELTTAVQHDLPVIGIVLDNGAWGAEKAYQRDFFGGRYLGAELHNPPYHAFAELVGARGYAVTQPGELGAALRDALAEGKPAVIEVKVDPDAMFSLRKDLFRKPDEEGA
ncbi:MAG: thiamine pyrophosphate-binding protein [Rhodospirillaceae bacterium]|nr:thiamine pyrophosphate-binding protein [Rhodospirillaceae bacterium]MBT7615292.1 thiamine pyrophosphate-binding protein [Rhodospirillaceae bacterium]